MIILRHEHLLPLFPFLGGNTYLTIVCLPESFCSHRFVGHFSFYNNMIIGFYIFIFICSLKGYAFTWFKIQKLPR